MSTAIPSSAAASARPAANAVGSAPAFAASSNQLTAAAAGEPRSRSPAARYASAGGRSPRTRGA